MYTKEQKEFIDACGEGNLTYVKEILENNPSINVSIDNEHAFKLACGNGHLQVAKWLLLVKPTIDVSTDNEGAFQMACICGHFYVAKWLQSLMPFKYVIKIHSYSYAPNIFIALTYGLKQILRPTNEANALALLTILEKTQHLQFINANLLCDFTKQN